MDKIKECFQQFYSNKKLFWGVVGGVAALLVILGVVLALVLGGGSAVKNCTVTVKTEGGMALEDIGVYVYTDESKSEMVAFGKTNEQGVAAIDAEVPSGSVAVLEGVAAGYVAADSYPITQADTQIVLTMELLKEMAPISLGGVMFDFTVTDTDGVSYTLSQLLQEKKAVVLNLWYTNCGPCKSEFPYLQAAYDKYSDNIALLALNPYAEDDEAAIKAFKEENALTMPMAKVDATWIDQISSMAYPTTIVIDRYGMVSLLHIGGIDEAEVFENAFAFFTAENYVQTKVENIYSLNTGAADAKPGTKENPIVPENYAEFSVEVPAGETVYYNLGQASGCVLTANSETLNITCGTLQVTPVEGVLKMMLVGAQDGSSPILVAFTNTGAQAETYQIVVAQEEGGKENPIVLMQIGDLTADVVAGNVSGVYYTYTVTENGHFAITVAQDDAAAYDIMLTNINSGKTSLLSVDGQENAKAKTKAVSVAVNKGDQVQINVTVMADENGNYNAATVAFNAAIVQEEISSGNSGSSNSGSSDSGNSGGSSSGSSGGLVNPDAPIEIGGKLRFDAEIEAGTRVYYQIRGVSGTTLCIYDSDAYVIYNGKTYEPNSSGNVFVWVETDDTHSPVEVEIGNSGSSKKTFSVSFYYPEGSKENPYELKLDESFSTALKSGNAVGVFYTFKANEAGRLKITLEDADGIECEINIQNKDTSVTILRNLSDSPNGTYTYMDLKANEEVVIWIVAYPDSNFNYPAADIVAKATFG